MQPQVLEPGPVRLDVALAVAPEAARHARPWIADDELPDLAPNRMPVRIEHVGRHPAHRSGERARPKVRDDVAAQEAARDLGPARVVDDGDPAAADVLEVPLEPLR